MEINQIKSSPGDPGQGESGYEGEILLWSFFFFGVVLTSDLYTFLSSTGFLFISLTVRKTSVYDSKNKVSSILCKKHL